MSELLNILKVWSAAKSQGQSAILATVVRIKGSAYRQPGARMLVTSEGKQFGMVSGGCLESDILRKAWWLTASGSPVLRHYDARMNEEAVWEFGLGCDGSVDVLIEKLEPEAEPGYLNTLQLWLQSNTPGALASVISSSIEGSRVGDRFCWPCCGGKISLPSALNARLSLEMESALSEGRSRLVRCISPSGGATFLIEMIRPPTKIIIFGSGPDIIPLATTAKLIGWAVTVVNPSGTVFNLPRSIQLDRLVTGTVDQCLDTLGLDSGSVCVLMTHNYFIDCTLLGPLLESNPQYLGILGPRTRTEQMLREIKLESFCSGPSRCLHYPAGLDIGTETPEQIAIAIAAEIHAVLAERSAQKLSGRKGPIHEALSEEELSIMESH
jgi:xanthine dehydrogenase accessory factor